jgi:hypothetical protein
MATTNLRMLQVETDNHDNRFGFAAIPLNHNRISRADNDAPTPRKLLTKRAPKRSHFKKTKSNIPTFTESLLRLAL